MYVIVDYKTNIRVKESYPTFMEAFKVYNEINKPTYKIEHWDFENNTCKLVWTHSYNNALV